MDFFRRYLLFIQLLFMNWIGKIGVILASTAFISFFILEGLSFLGFFRSTYTGIVTYFLIPMIFVIGLILLPIAWAKQKQETGQTLQQVFIDKIDFVGIS